MPEKRTLIIDGAATESMEQLHRRFCETFGFPPFYGGTLDSLYDCLSDIAEFDADILIVDFAALEKSIGVKYAAGLRRVLCDCAEENPHINVEFMN